MGVQIEQLKTSDFFLFLQKKPKLLFFKFSPTFGFVFFLLLKTLKYLWNKWLHLQRFWYRFARFFLIWLQHLLSPFFNFIVPMHVLIVSVSHVVPVFVPFFLNYNESSIEESSPIQTQKFSELFRWCTVFNPYSIEISLKNPITFFSFAAVVLR